MEKACETCVHKDKPSFSATCVECGFAMMNYEHIPFTNADRIRSMTDEELAHFLEMKAGRFVSFYPTPAKNWLDWLRQEATDGKQD